MPSSKLSPNTLVRAYATGVFPMADDDGRIQWFSPDPRAIIALDAFHVSKNLRRRCASDRFTVTVDGDFSGVIEACANRPEGTWISPYIRRAYTELHKLGFAHSVETRRDGRLVGGLYGVALGGAFFGESMFHRETDASKVALVHLVSLLRKRGFSLLDLQFMTDHLQRFGAVEIPRDEYLDRLKIALSQKCVLTDEQKDAAAP